MMISATSPSLLPLVISSVLMVEDNFVCRVKRSFKPYQNEHNSLEDTGEKGKKPCNIDPKIAKKILFYYPPTSQFI